MALTCRSLGAEHRTKQSVSTSWSPTSKARMSSASFSDAASAAATASSWARSEIVIGTILPCGSGCEVLAEDDDHVGHGLAAVRGRHRAVREAQRTGHPLAPPDALL